MDTRMFRQPGDYDAEFESMNRDGIAALTGTATTGFLVGLCPTGRKLYLDRLAIGCRTVPTSASTLLATFKKKNAGTVVSLNIPVDTQPATGDLRTLTADVGQLITIATPSAGGTVTDANRIFLPGDCLVCDIAAAGALTGQPGELMLIGFFKMIR